MNKKMLSVLVILLSLMLSACGGGNDEPEITINKVTPEEISESSEAEEKVEKEEPEEKEPEKEEPEEKAEDTSSSESDGAEMMPAVDDQVIYDDNDVKITANNLRIDTNNGNVLINLDLENNTGKNILMTADTIYVDGEKIEGAAMCSAGKGESGYGDVAIYGDSLKENNIDEFFKSVEFEMTAVNNDDYLEEYFKTGKLTIEVTKGEVQTSENEEDSAAADNAAGDADSSGSTGNSDGPWDIQWFLDYANTGGESMMDKDIKMLKEEEYSGEWKACFVFYEDDGAGGKEEYRDYMSADIESDKKGIKVTLHPLYRYDSKTKEGEDISGEPDMKFSGKWNDQGDYTATGDGTIDMVIFEADGEQYSVGGFTAPSGEKAAVAINR